jgi:DNA repair photolyase
MTSFSPPVTETPHSQTLQKSELLAPIGIAQKAKKIIQIMPLAGVRGRGITAQASPRYEVWQRHALDDDGRTARHTDAQVPTTWRWEDAKTALSRNQSPDLPFALTLNPYRGCEHGCIYCYARPSHAWLGLSPGLDFETKLVAKRGLAQALARQIASRAHVPQRIVIGAVTDAYQPLERHLRVTRDCLQVLADARHPVSIITKGAGIERDIDLLQALAAHDLVSVYVSLNTLDARTSHLLEPRAPSPTRRLKVIERLSQAGIPVGVSLAPQIPFLTDDLERVLQAAAQAGAGRAFYTVLRLPLEVAPLFAHALHTHWPDRAERVLARVRDLHDGALYRSDFATRMKGSGVWSHLLAQRFAKACDRLGLQRDRHELAVAGDVGGTRAAVAPRIPMAKTASAALRPPIVSGTEQAVQGDLFAPQP